MPTGTCSLGLAASQQENRARKSLANVPAHRIRKVLHLVALKETFQPIFGVLLQPVNDKLQNDDG